MIYLCPQRGCSGVHNLTQEDVGRTFTCNKCSSTLRFDGDGLRLLSPAPSPTPRAGRPAPAGRPDAPAEEDLPLLGASEAPRPAAPTRRTHPNPEPRNPAPMSPNPSSGSEIR